MKPFGAWLQRLRGGGDDLTLVREVVDCLEEGVLVVDELARVRFMNHAAEQLTGYRVHSCAGATIDQVLGLDGPNAMDIVTSLRRTSIDDLDDSASHIVEVTTAGGAVTPVRLRVAELESGSDLALCISMLPAPVSEESSRDYQDHGRFDALATLTGGVAHDLNTMLTVVASSIDLAMCDIRDRDECENHLENARKAARRARQVAGQLLRLAASPNSERSAIAVGKLLRELTVLAASGSATRFSIELAQPLYRVDADEVDLSQIFINLLINADQAMPEGGEVFVTAAMVAGDDLPPGLDRDRSHWLRVTVQDQGHGIPEDQIEQVFEPFFTTKETGTGLGLTTVSSLVSKYEGQIDVDSRPGLGARFMVFLPALDEIENDETEDVERQDAVRGKGRILFMDDEAIVRDLVHNALSYLGYSVDCCHDGAQAIRMYRSALESGQGYELVVMDLTVPGGIGGKEAVADLIELDPKVRAIACSGYPKDPVFTNWVDHGFCGALLKPFDLHELGHKISEVLDGGGSAS